MAKIKKGSEIQVGDFVRVSNHGSEVDMSPVSLIVAGWPNGEFNVLAKWTHSPEGKGKGLVPKPVECITLWPCCRFLRNPATGQYLCDGHPLNLFEKIDPPPDRDHQRPSAELAIDGPKGEFASLSYYESEEDAPALVLGGLSNRPISVSGTVAKAIAKLLREGGIL